MECPICNDKCQVPTIATSTDGFYHSHGRRNGATKACATPRVCTLTTELVAPKDATTTMLDVDMACRAWLDFCWNNGGGLPLLFTFPNNDKNDASHHHTRFPPYLRENLTQKVWSHTNIQEEVAEICYTADSSGWLSFPLLWHTHEARVRFYPTSATGAVRMEWIVQIRPFGGLLAAASRSSI